MYYPLPATVFRRVRNFALPERRFVDQVRDRNRWYVWAAIEGLRGQGIYAQFNRTLHCECDGRIVRLRPIVGYLMLKPRKRLGVWGQRPYRRWYRFPLRYRLEDRPDGWIMYFPQSGALVIPDSILPPGWQTMQISKFSRWWKYWERWDVVRTIPYVPDDLAE